MWQYAYLECVSCGAAQQVGYEGYVCPNCGNNLLVRYDSEHLRREVREGRFPDRARSDIRRYAAVLPVAEEQFFPPLRVGGTPLYARPHLAAALGISELFFKDDGLNPSGSLKDRASAVALAVARARGVSMVAGASTGNAGSSMACMAAATGTPCTIFVPAAAPEAKIAQLLVFGARVVAVRGSYDDAFDLCLKLCGKYGWFNRNTGYNPFTREGKKTVAYEICEQLRWEPPDWIVVPVGDGNIISAVGKGLEEMLAMGLIRRMPRLLCAQAATSDAISRTLWKIGRSGAERTTGAATWRELPGLMESVPGAHTVADSICVDRPRDGVAAVRAILESGGAAVTVDDGAILQAIAELGRKAAIFAEPAAAVTWACLRKAVDTGVVEKSARVVCLITGSGLKDVASAQHAVGKPLQVEPDVEAVEKCLGL